MSHWPPCSSQQLERAFHPRARVVVGRLEPEHEERVLPVPSTRQLRLGGSRRRQLQGYRPACESARTASAPAAKSGKRTPAEARCVGPGLETHPRLGDDPEGALGADQHPVGAAGRRPSRAAAATATPRRRDRPDRLDEVVDVRVERGEVAAGAGGDPAAERRELERLGEVAQRQPVLVSCSSAPARSRRPGCGRRARRGSTSSTWSRRRRSSETAAGPSKRGSTPPTTLVPPPYGMAAAPTLSHHSSTRSTSVSSRERRRRRAGGRSARERRGRCRGRPCRRNGRRGRRGPRSRSRSARGAARRAARAAPRPRSAPAARDPGSQSPARGAIPCAAARISSGDGCSSS